MDLDLRLFEYGLSASFGLSCFPGLVAGKLDELDAGCAN